MRIWTDGTMCRAWLSVGRVVVRQGKARLESGPDNQHGPADPVGDCDIVAPSPSGGRDLASDLGADVVDAIALDERRLAQVLAVEKALELRIGVEGVAPTQSISLNLEAQRVKWPQGVIWQTPPSFGRGKAFGAARKRNVRLSLSAHGLAVAASASGHVGVLRAEANTLDPVLRLPGIEAGSIHALATAHGVLVTVVVEGSHSTLLHLDAQGAVLGRWPDKPFGSGMLPPLLLGEHVLAYDGEANRVALLSLPDLAEVEIVAGPSGMVDAASRGHRFALCSGTQIVTGILENARIVLDEPVSVVGLVQVARSTASRSKTFPIKLADGPTAVTFPAIKRPATPWTAAAGSSIEIDLFLRSSGKPGQGVEIVAGGAAIADGNVLLETIENEDQTARFGAPAGGEQSAVLPDLVLPHGIAHPVQPPAKTEDDRAAVNAALAATHIELVVRGRAIAPGAPLLAIGVRALSGSAPVKWTRPVTISPT